MKLSGIISGTEEPELKNQYKKFSISYPQGFVLPKIVNGNGGFSLLFLVIQPK